MQDLARTTNNMASTFTSVLGPALDEVTDKLNKFTAGLDSATGGGGGSGLWYDDTSPMTDP